MAVAGGVVVGTDNTFSAVGAVILDVVAIVIAVVVGAAVVIESTVAVDGDVADSAGCETRGCVH